MSEDPKNIPVLNYAPASPRPLRRKIIIGLAAGAVGLTIAAGAYRYHISRVKTVPLMGIVLPAKIEWESIRSESAIEDNLKMPDSSVNHPPEEGESP